MRGGGGEGGGAGREARRAVPRLMQGEAFAGIDTFAWQTEREKEIPNQTVPQVR